MDVSPPAVAPAVAPPRGNPRFPLLDGMRAIAALLIVVTHAAGDSGFNVNSPLGVYTARMNFGVTIFFLLSGFLLYRPFVAARRQGRPPIAIRTFFRRRVLRIIPAYWVALTLLAIWPGLFAFSEFWPRLYSLTQIYWADSTLAGIGPAWSLCIEASFYLVLPFLALGIARLRPSVGGEIGLLAALAVACLAFRSVCHAVGGFEVVLNTLPCFIDWFCWGMILAVISVAHQGRETDSRALATIVRRPWVPWVAALVVFWFLSTQIGLSPNAFAFLYTDVNFFGEHFLYALCAALLLLPAVFGDWAGGRGRRLIGTPLMAWLGLISYAIFLYHAPLMSKLHEHNADSWLPGSGFLSLLIATLVVTIPIAAASYRFVERPVLRFKDPRRRGDEPPPSTPPESRPHEPAPVAAAGRAG